MRHSIFKALMLIAILIGIVFHASAQGPDIALVVTKTNGQEQTYQLNEDSRMHFENGEQLVIKDVAGATITIQLAEIRKLVCTEITGVSESNASQPLLIPNPTRDHFLINNLQSECEAHLYTLDGRLVKSFTATEGQMIDISDLIPGMYLLHIDGQILKMMKL